MPKMDRMGDPPIAGGRSKRAAGGSTNALAALEPKPTATDKVNQYNAEGSPEMEEATNRTPSFKRGGRGKRKAGGVAEGMMAGGRLDRPKRAAGGRAGGHSPYSSGKNLTAPTADKAGSGHQSSGPA